MAELTGWAVALPLLMICEGVVMLAAFWLGAWAREPFKLGRKKKAERPSEAEVARKKQQGNMLNYSVDDARRAARESGRFE